MDFNKRPERDDARRASKERMLQKGWQHSAKPYSKKCWARVRTSRELNEQGMMMRAEVIKDRKYRAL